MSIMENSVSFGQLCSETSCLGRIGRIEATGLAAIASVADALVTSLQTELRRRFGRIDPANRRRPSSLGADRATADRYATLDA